MGFLKLACRTNRPSWVKKLRFKCSVKYLAACKLSNLFLHLQLCAFLLACCHSWAMFISRSLHGNTAANPGLSRLAHVQQSTHWYDVYLTTLSHTGDFWARFFLHQPRILSGLTRPSWNRLLPLKQAVCRCTKPCQLLVFLHTHTYTFLFHAHSHALLFTNNNVA